jgi:hypothetical protein
MYYPNLLEKEIPEKAAASWRKVVIWNGKRCPRSKKGAKIAVTGGRPRRKLATTRHKVG